MTSRRLLKAAEAIRSVLGMAILAEIKDPRVRNVTLVGVEVMPDMKQAKVHVSVMGDEKQQKLTLRGLQNSAGFLQKRISERIDTRYVPRLEFVLDPGIKNSLEIDRILRRVLPTDGTEADAADAEADESDIVESDVVESEITDQIESHDDDDEDADMHDEDETNDETDGSQPSS